MRLVTLTELRDKLPSTEIFSLLGTHQQNPKAILSSWTSALLTQLKGPFLPLGSDKTEQIRVSDEDRMLRLMKKTKGLGSWVIVINTAGQNVQPYLQDIRTIVKGMFVLSGVHLYDGSGFLVALTPYRQQMRVSSCRGAGR